MKKPSVYILKKYLAAMSKIKRKYITAESLSHSIGVYPDVINENLSYFEPMLTMDSTINLLELVPAIKAYINEEENKKSHPQVKVVVEKKEIEEYKSINDFVYKRYTVGGMLDRGVELSDKDLKIMKKLITEEQQRRKEK